MTPRERLTAELVSAERRVRRLQRAIQTAAIEEITGGAPIEDVGFWGFLGSLLGFRTRQERAWERLSPEWQQMIRALDPEAVPASER